jgi:hypothetical protein
MGLDALDKQMSPRDFHFSARLTGLPISFTGRRQLYTRQHHGGSRRLQSTEQEMPSNIYQRMNDRRRED